MKRYILLTLFGAISLFNSNAQCTVACVANTTPDPCTFNFIGTQMSAITYHWDFGDGNISPNGTVFSHTYTSSGIFTACFIGYDSLGVPCDSDCVNVNAVSCSGICNPIGTSMFVSGCTYNFAASLGGADSFIWDFGDGYTSTNMNPSHTFFTSGTHNVCLIGFDAGGDTCGTHCFTVTTSGCAPSSCVMTFTTGSTSGCTYIFYGAESGATTYSWDFGDGTTNNTTLSPITHVFPSDGTYTVTLIGYDGSGNVCGYYSQIYTVTGCGTGIDEIDNSSTLKLYPNPATSMLTVATETQNAFGYKIFDANGKLVSSEFSNTPNAQIDIRLLHNGYYTVVAYTYFGEKLGSKHFVKSN